MKHHILTEHEIGTPILDALGIDYRKELIKSVTLRLRADKIPTMVIERYVLAADGSPDVSTGEFRTAFSKYELKLKEPVLEEKSVLSITFDGLVSYGLGHGANIVNGMPWSFDYEVGGKTYRVSHENDDCYIVGQLMFRRGDTLHVSEAGSLTVEHA